MIFNQNLWDYSRRIAIISEDSQHITYLELLNSAEIIGKLIKERCLVFIICKNNFDSIVGYLGFLMVGAALVLIDEKIDKRFFLNLYEKYLDQIYPLFLDQKNYYIFCL